MRKRRLIASILTVAMMISVAAPLSAYADDGEELFDDHGYDVVDESYNLEEADLYDIEEPGDGIALQSATHTMDELRQMFPAGKYWNHAGMSGNNAEGWTNTPCNHSKTTSTCNHYVRPNGQSWSSQCMGYAQELAYLYYGSDPINQKLRTDKAAVDILKPGDVVRYRNNTHSIFITAVNGDDITFTDCNWGNKCIIRWDVHITKSKLKETFTNVRLAPGPRPGEVDHCSTEYAGWYKVKSSDGISVNSGHNFNSKISEIPNGAIVYITKATGLGRSQVGHIQYNGSECYLAMNLLTRMSGIESGHLWAGYDDPANNYLNGEVVVRGNVFDWKDLNENLQVRVVADSGQEATGMADQSRYNLLLDNYTIGTNAQQDQGANHDFEVRLSGLSVGNHTFHVQVSSQGNWVEVGTVDAEMPEVHKLLKVTANPTKTEYTVGDTLDTTGLVLKEIYTLANETVGNLKEVEVTSGSTCTPETLDTAGTQTITVTYDGVSTSFDVTVKEKETPKPEPDVKEDKLEKLEIETLPDKTTYTSGDMLDTTGLTLKAIYSVSGEKIIANGFTCTPEILDTAGTQTVTVAYNGVKTSFNVTVKAKETPNPDDNTTTKPDPDNPSEEQDKLEFEMIPIKRKYTVGDRLDDSGMVLKWTHQGKEHTILYGYTCTPEILDKVGTQTVTVSYMGLSVTYQVEVKAKDTTNPSGTTTNPSGDSTTTKPDTTVDKPSDDGSGIAMVLLVGGAVVVVGGITWAVISAMPVEVRATAISSDRSVIAYAPVTLMQGDRVVAETVTDGNGSFSFNVKRGNYTLRMTTTDPVTGRTVTRMASISAPANGTVVTF